MKQHETILNSQNVFSKGEKALRTRRELPNVRRCNVRRCSALFVPTGSERRCPDCTARRLSRGLVSSFREHLTKTEERRMIPKTRALTLDEWQSVDALGKRQMSRLQHGKQGTRDLGTGPDSDSAEREPAKSGKYRPSMTPLQAAVICGYVSAAELAGELPGDLAQAEAEAEAEAQALDLAEVLQSLSAALQRAQRVADDGASDLPSVSAGKQGGPKMTERLDAIATVGASR